mmetsp:Transcript_3348/g.8586  ORF Transcript_3348/g.8586 Transcript_3348/m.8586 type:complete len:262 (+) Transcript_3348:360-1145(+)
MDVCGAGEEASLRHVPLGQDDWKSQACESSNHVRQPIQAADPLVQLVLTEDVDRHQRHPVLDSHLNEAQSCGEECLLLVLPGGCLLLDATWLDRQGPPFAEDRLHRPSIHRPCVGHREDLANERDFEQHWDARAEPLLLVRLRCNSLCSQQVCGHVRHEAVRMPDIDVLLRRSFQATSALRHKPDAIQPRTRPHESGAELPRPQGAAWPAFLDGALQSLKAPPAKRRVGEAQAATQERHCKHGHSASGGSKGGATGRMRGQ